MNKREEARRVAYQELLDRYNGERIKHLERLRRGKRESSFMPSWSDRDRDVPFDLWYALELQAHQAAQREFDNETRAYAARAKSLGLCKCEENAE